MASCEDLVLATDRQTLQLCNVGQYVLMILIMCVLIFARLQNADSFTLNAAALEDGKGKCPYDPAKGHTGLIVGKYSHVYIHV